MKLIATVGLTVQLLWLLFTGGITAGGSLNNDGRFNFGADAGLSGSIGAGIGNGLALGGGFTGGIGAGGSFGF